MIKPEQVPKEAADALQKLISRGVFTSTEEAIAAAINAWTGMEADRILRARNDGSAVFEPRIILPLQQVPCDE